MNNNKFNNIFSVFLVLTLIVFAVGCGGGGGGGGSSNPVAPGTDLNPSSVVAPGTTALAAEGNTFLYAAAPAANIALKLPVDVAEAKFALIITNPNTVAQDIRIKPESYVLGNVRGPASSLRVNGAVDDYGQLLMNQAPLETNLRLKANLMASQSNVRASRSLRAADHSSENVGDLVSLSIVGDQFGWSYITRSCKLERMSAHCKLFVDQESYGGLSAVTGVDAVTSADLDHFVAEFETHIHSLITNGYSPVYDIDADGRVSILISPVYSKLGFAGLFNSNNMTNTPNSNLRDLIALFSPNSSQGWSGEKWREATRETICHEMQHLVNYSAHLHFNSVGSMEEEWLDESFSVGVEARYRLLRGSAAIENRFKLWASSPSSTGLINFNRALAQYGMVGLFNFFLFEQSDTATIKSMINSTTLGKANVDAAFASRGGMNGMLRSWAMAALMDTLRTKGFTNINSIDASYKYKTPIGLDIEYTTVPYGYSTTPVTVPAYGAAFYVVNQPAGFSSTEYQFRIESTAGQPIDVVMVRLPNP